MRAWYPRLAAKPAGQASRRLLILDFPDGTPGLFCRPSGTCSLFLFYPRTDVLCAKLLRRSAAGFPTLRTAHMVAPEFHTETECVL